MGVLLLAPTNSSGPLLDIHMSSDWLELLMLGLPASTDTLHKGVLFFIISNPITLPQYVGLAREQMNKEMQEHAL